MRNFRCLLPAALLALALTGCGGQPQPAETVETPPAHTGAAAPPQQPDAPAAAPERPRPVFLDRELMLNGSFAVWEDGLPTHWQFQNARAIERAAGAAPGSNAVQLNPLEDERWVALSRAIAADQTILGGRLVATAFANADAEELLGLSIRIEAGGETIRRKTFHPGTGAWRTLRIEMDIPANANPETLTYEIFRQPGRAGTAKVDLAKMSITK